MYEDNYNIVDRLVHQHIKSNDKTALIDSTVEWSYTQLQTFIFKFHSYLISHSLSPLQIIVLILDDSVFAFGCLLGVINSGYIAAPINPHLPAHTYINYFKKINPSLVLVESTLFLSLSSICSDLDIQCYAITTSQILAYPAKEGCVLGKWDRPAFALFTSGTTGLPKCILHRHKDMEVIAKNYARSVLNIQSADVTYITSRFFFGYGLNSILFSLYFHCTAYLPEKELNLHNIWARLEQKNISLFFSVPTIYGLLLNEKNIPNQITPRICVSAGEPLPEIIQNKWCEKFRSPIIDGIGSTEILSTYISNTPKEFKKNSSGKAVSGFEIKLLSENGQPVKKDEIGILYIKGDTYTASYHNDIDISKNLFSNRWFKTNDLFICDSDGFYFYQGRYDDVFKCGGVWICPYKLENILMSHPLVANCVVVGKKDQNGLMRSLAYVVLRDEKLIPHADLIDELRTYCKNKVSKWEYPHFIEFVKELYFTASGKKKRFLLKDRG